MQRRRRPRHGRTAGHAVVCARGNGSVGSPPAMDVPAEISPVAQPGFATAAAATAAGPADCARRAAKVVDRIAGRLHGATNIRWGELIGGLLVVCSSVGLVVSFWAELQLIPYIEFFIFVGISAAVFGVGLYAHHRWKLAATSSGLLMIATLLVPLNFVAMAMPTKGAAPEGGLLLFRAITSGVAGHLCLAVEPGRQGAGAQRPLAGRGGHRGQFGGHTGHHAADRARRPNPSCPPGCNWMPVCRRGCCCWPA